MNETLIQENLRLKASLEVATAIIDRINNQKPVGIFRGEDVRFGNEVKFVEVEWISSLPIEPNTLIFAEPKFIAKDIAKDVSPILKQEATGQRKTVPLLTGRFLRE
jgi:hypothetical protein